MVGMPFRTVLAGIALAVVAVPQAAFAQLTCTAPNPVNRPAAAQKYFMVVVDSSGSMTNAVPGAIDSCNFNSIGGPNAARIDHARCAVNRLVSQFSGTVDFGIAQYATTATSSSSACYAGWSANTYAQEAATTGMNLGCGPRTGLASTRAGARILAPVNPNLNSVLPWVDNNCSGGVEVSQVGSTPLNGALRDMRRYFQNQWVAPDNSVSYATPLSGNTCTGRSVNVLLLTDGDETCDTQADAVAAAQDLYANGVTVAGIHYSIKTYVVNFAGGSTANTDAIAAAGGTGTSYLANNEAQLLTAMQQIMAAPSDPFNGADDDCNACIDDGWSNLALTGSAAPAVAGPGEAVTYTFQATNAGPTNADARVEISSVTGGGALSGSVALVGPGGWSCTGSACTNANFPVGMVATFTLTPTIAAAATEGMSPAYALTIRPLQYVKDPTAADNSASASVTVHVKLTPTITWPNPADITFGAVLDAPQLTATASTTGTFVYSPPAGTALPVGAHTILVDFTPDNPADYNSASASATITVVKAPQTIFFSPLPNQNFSAGTVAVSGTASSGLPVSFTAAGACTVSGIVVTFTTDGTCTVTAVQGGDDSYLAATPVDQAFTIAPAPQTIAFGAIGNQTFGVGVIGVGASASSGLPVTFSATGSCTLAGPATPTGPGYYLVNVTITAAGNCTVTASQVGGAGYAAAPSVDQTFTIAPAPQTITFGSIANQTFGVGPFPVGATASSGLPVSFSAIGSCSVTGNVVTVTGAGNCSLTATQPGTQNYAGATATTSFAILKATPTVSVTGGSFNYDGGPHPAVASTIGVGGASLVPVTITYNGSTTVPVAAGTYAVVATFAGDANYNPATATATVTIIVVNGPPVCTAATARPSVVWPPNHEMQRIQILGVTDPDRDPVSLLVTRIFQDEPTNTDDDRRHAPDGQGIGTSTAYVRAERTGNKGRDGNGRVYHISFTANDGHGGSCTGEVTVGVRHDQRGTPAVDDGPRYDSTVIFPLGEHGEDNCSDESHDHRKKTDKRDQERDDGRDDRSRSKRAGSF